jgi:hypothetical protein
MKFDIIKLKEKNFFKTELGFLLKLLSNKNCKFKNIREVYLTSVNKNKIKGWNMHSKFTTNLILISGRVNFYLSQNSKSFKKILIDSKIKKMIKIYPNTFFAFKGLEKENIFLSMSSGVHNKREIKKVTFKGK